MNYRTHFSLHYFFPLIFLLFLRPDNFKTQPNTMNKTNQFLSVAFILLSISTLAQNTKPGVGIDPFAKGNWSFDLNRIGAYNQTTYYRNDDKLFEETEA